MKRDLVLEINTFFLGTMAGTMLLHPSPNALHVIAGIVCLLGAISNASLVIWPIRPEQGEE